MIMVILTTLQLTGFVMIEQNIQYTCHYVLTVLLMYNKPTWLPAIRSTFTFTGSEYYPKIILRPEL